MSATPALGSILLGSSDPDRLRRWYAAAFDAEPDDDGFLEFGRVAVLIQHRDDVAAVNPEPSRVILNFHLRDLAAIEDRLVAKGAVWVREVERTPCGRIGTVLDPDGNYVQIIEDCRRPG